MVNDIIVHATQHDRNRERRRELTDEDVIFWTSIGAKVRDRTKKMLLLYDITLEDAKNNANGQYVVSARQKINAFPFLEVE